MALQFWVSACQLLLINLFAHLSQASKSAGETGGMSTPKSRLSSTSGRWGEMLVLGLYVPSGLTMTWFPPIPTLLRSTTLQNTQ